MGKFKVNFKGRTGINYSEGKRKMRIDSEVIYDPIGITIYKDSIRSWNVPYENEKLSKDEQERILDNIISDLKKHGYSVVVI